MHMRLLNFVLIKTKILLLEVVLVLFGMCVQRGNCT